MTSKTTSKGPQKGPRNDFQNDLQKDLQGGALEEVFKRPHSLDPHVRAFILTSEPLSSREGLTLKITSKWTST